MKRISYRIMDSAAAATGVAVLTGAILALTGALFSFLNTDMVSYLVRIAKTADFGLLASVLSSIASVIMVVTVSSLILAVRQRHDSRVSQDREQEMLMLEIELLRKRIARDFRDQDTVKVEADRALRLVRELVTNAPGKQRDLFEEGEERHQTGAH